MLESEPNKEGQEPQPTILTPDGKYAIQTKVGEKDETILLTPDDLVHFKDAKQIEQAGYRKLHDAEKLMADAEARAETLAAEKFNAWLKNLNLPGGDVVHNTTAQPGAGGGPGVGASELDKAIETLPDDLKGSIGGILRQQNETIARLVRGYETVEKEVVPRVQAVISGQEGQKAFAAAYRELNSVATAMENGQLKYPFLQDEFKNFDPENPDTSPIINDLFELAAARRATNTNWTFADEVERYAQQETKKQESYLIQEKAKVAANVNLNFATRGGSAQPMFKTHQEALDYFHEHGV